MRILLAVLVGVMASSVAGGEPAKLAFQKPEGGYAGFDTGQLRGKVRLDGKQQGVISVVYAPTGLRVDHSVGLFSYYRVFSSGARYGQAARDWPLEAKLLDDGALRVVFPPAKEHPLEMTGTFRWRAADTLDLETTVTPQVDMPRFEVFLSSYLIEGFDAWAYTKPNTRSRDKAVTFVKADWNELIDGNYIVFPRDPKALSTIYDGRWEIPPSPVTWAFVRYLAAPVVVRRQEGGLSGVFMSPPEDCFAISVSYNRKPADGVAGHGSVYMSLFGRDVAAGQTAKARCRVIIAPGLSDQAVVERYQAYLKELAP
jgi:hypothetical protein